MPLPDLREPPLVSVLIANYNYAHYIGEAIESLQGQSHSNFEVVICDDGSSDDSRAIIKGYAAADSRIQLHEKENAGQASALNFAFSRSCGDIICILDADDTFVSTKIQAVIRTFVRNPQSGIVIHDLLIMDGNGRKKGESRFAQEGYLGPEIPTLRLGLPMPQASGLSFRREVLEEILPLPEEEFRSCADWAIAYAAAYLTNTSRIPEILARYRIHGSNLSGSTSTAPELQEEAIAQILSGMNRVLSFTDQFVRTRFNTSVAATQVRNILEHRLMLCLLRKDKASLFSAALDLKNAYHRARRDYPSSRYLFWQVLSRLPATVGQTILALAFRAFQFQRAIRET